MQNHRCMFDRWIMTLPFLVNLSGSLTIKALTPLLIYFSQSDIITQGQGCCLKFGKLSRIWVDKLWNGGLWSSNVSSTTAANLSKVLPQWKTWQDEFAHAWSDSNVHQLAPSVKLTGKVGPRNTESGGVLTKQDHRLDTQHL